MPALPATSTSNGAGGFAVFEPARFERLHRIVNEAASNPVHLSRSNDWFVTIDRNRSDLADLGKVRPPSDVERKEIESGMYSTTQLQPAVLLADHVRLRTHADLYHFH